MKVLLSIMLVLGLGAGGFFLWKKAQDENSTSRNHKRPDTATVEARDIHFAVTVAGEIAPAEQVSVRPEINGRIAALSVDVGDKVKKSDVLFRLDDKELQNEKSSSLVEIDRARLQLEQSRRNQKRNQELFKGNLISEELADASHTELELASNALQRAERDLAVIEERLTKAILVAPFDCTVLVRPVSVGQAVSGSGGVGGGTEVLVIADLNKMIINAHVNQADVPRLKHGLDVEVNIEAVPGLKVNGLVERIAPQATVKNNIKGFATRIAIKDLDPRIQPGMTANITIPVASAEGVLAVPLAAVFSEPTERSGVERFVFVKKGAEDFEKRPVQIGLSDYFFAEVVSGLEEGDVVSLEQPAGEPGVKAEKGGATAGQRSAMGAQDGRGTSGRGETRGSARTNALGAGSGPRPGRNGS